MALADYGYELSDERSLMLRSLGRPFAPMQFREWFGDDLDYDLIRKRRKEYVEGHIERHGITLKPGVVEVLKKLRSLDIKVSIATATDLERTTKYLKMTGIYDYFEQIVCATMVKNGKPAPDIYEYALSRLNASASDCYAVEDAPNGVKSAYTAGIKVIFVPDQAPSDETFKDMIYAEIPIISDIPRIISAV